MLAFDQPPFNKISSRGTPSCMALLNAAALVLPGLKTELSMPAFPMTSFTHLEIVSLDTGLYGFLVVIIICSISPRSSDVLFKYIFKYLATHFLAMEKIKVQYLRLIARSPLLQITVVKEKLYTSFQDFHIVQS